MPMKRSQLQLHAGGISCLAPSYLADPPTAAEPALELLRELSPIFAELYLASLPLVLSSPQSYSLRHNLGKESAIANPRGIR